MKDRKVYEAPESEPLVLDTETDVLVNGSSESLTQTNGEWGEEE